MIEINPSQWKTKPYDHQIEGVRKLCEHRAFALFCEMVSGKSKQVIDAACTLFQAGQVDCVVIVAPASVRSVWLDPELGQLQKHCWVKSEVFEYHQQVRQVWSTAHEAAGTTLTWVVTNYEFLRPLKQDNHRASDLYDLLSTCPKIMLVLDESSAIKSRTSKQTKAIGALRKLATRCVILNGTPISNTPLDLWAQLDVLDHRILGRHYKNFYHFKYSHCLMGGWHEKQVLGWRDLEKVQLLVRPHCLRRLKRDCLDLPPKLGGIES